MNAIRQAGLFIAGVATTLAGCGGPITVDDLTSGRAPDAVVTYKTVGQQELKLHVFEARGDSEGPRPAVLFIHGGGWRYGNVEQTYPLCRYFSERGAVTATVDYRLAGKGGWTIFDCLSDCESALRALRDNAKELNVNPKRIVVAGGSAGGHLAACLATFERTTIDRRADAMILFYPALDLETIDWIRTVPGIDEDVAEPIRLKYGPSWRERAHGISPMHYVKGGLPPALLVHGTEDEVIPVAQSRRFATIMRKAGNRCRYVELVGAKHGFITPFRNTDRLLALSLLKADEFLISLGYLDGEPRIVAPDFGGSDDK